MNLTPTPRDVALRATRTSLIANVVYLLLCVTMIVLDLRSGTPDALLVTGDAVLVLAGAVMAWLNWREYRAQRAAEMPYRVAYIFTYVYAGAAALSTVAFVLEAFF